jgi:crotonobetaine/carnitine-CoA ligase
MDETGRYFFVDRLKDAIRRRGENISSFEVEHAVRLHPSVQDVAAYGVPDEMSGEEVMVAVLLRRGHELDGTALVEHCRDRMAHYMVPRYVRRVADLPKTETGKVLKRVLRDEGVTPDTFDREQFGLRIKRERLASPGILNRREND